MDAVIYARISKDRKGKALGVKRQVDRCTAKAKELGWTVVETYIDNDMTASKGKPRPEYERMLADLAAGTYGAVVVYDLDRLTRRLSELASFMDLHKAHGFELANVSGDVDLTTANGRMIAGIKGSVAQQEAERIAERVADQKAQRAAMGLPMGTRQRVYGFNRDWTHHPDEAPIVRELFARYIAGESQKSLSRWMQEQGHLTTAGTQWSERASNRLLTRMGYAGIYVFKGERVGMTTYDPIIDEATFEAANTNRIKGVSSNARKWLLSGILVCDLCKAPMIGSASGGKKPRYRCNTQMGGCGRMSILAEPVDKIVNAYMSQIVLIAAKAANPTEDEQVEDSRIADKDAEIVAIQNMDMDLADKVALLKKARAERAAIVKEQSEIVTVDAWKPLRDYDAADISVKRTAIRRYIKHLFVVPASGKVTTENIHERFYVLTGPNHGTPNTVVGWGGAINVYDMREPEHSSYAASQQSEE